MGLLNWVSNKVLQTSYDAYLQNLKLYYSYPL